MTNARLVRLIFVENLEGEGTPESPCRNVQRLFTPDGDLVAEYDCVNEEKSRAYRALSGLPRSCRDG